MVQAGVRLISFTGGEPLVRRDIGEIVAHVKSRGLVCKLNTNGMLLPQRLDELRQLDLLQISIDGPPHVQDRLRGPGTAERAAAAVRAARDAGIRVQLIACLTRENVAQLDEVLDFGLELKSGFCFQLLSDKELDEPSADQSVPGRTELLDALDYLLRLRRQRHPRARAIASHNSELRYYRDLLQNGSRGCECTLVTATMLPDGQLIFCGNARDYCSYDAVSLGFATAFSRLTIPQCDGCVCVGKLRLSRVYQWDLGLMREMLGLWR
jgi:MoaA/NifB/PqqE/SkfB family radical SAM enzyme